MDRGDWSPEESDMTEHACSSSSPSVTKLLQLGTAYFCWGSPTILSLAVKQKGVKKISCSGNLLSLIFTLCKMKKMKNFPTASLWSGPLVGSFASLWKSQTLCSEVGYYPNQK